MTVVPMAANSLTETVKFVLVNSGGLSFRSLMLSSTWVSADKGGIPLS